MPIAWTMPQSTAEVRGAMLLLVLGARSEFNIRFCRRGEFNVQFWTSLSESSLLILNGSNSCIKSFGKVHFAVSRLQLPLLLAQRCMAAWCNHKEHNNRNGNKNNNIDGACMVGEEEPAEHPNVSLRRMKSNAKNGRCQLEDGDTCTDTLRKSPKIWISGGRRILQGKCKV